MGDDYHATSPPRPKVHHHPPRLVRADRGVRARRGASLSGTAHHHHRMPGPHAAVRGPVANGPGSHRGSSSSRQHDDRTGDPRTSGRRAHVDHLAEDIMNRKWMWRGLVLLGALYAFALIPSSIRPQWTASPLRKPNATITVRVGAGNL